MKTSPLFPSLLFVWAIHLAGAAEPVTRTLTDIKGRTIEVALLSADAKAVKVRKTADGKEISIALDLLSKGDKEFITEWRKTQPEPGNVEKSNADVLPEFTMQVGNQEVVMHRHGSGGKGIVFFNHSGKMDADITRGIKDYQPLIDKGYSVFLWSYPDGRPFDKVQDVLAKGKGAIDFKGVATDIVNGIRAKTGIKELCLVGNSLGVGVLSWDYKALSADPSLRFVFISPTPLFMVSRASLGDLPRTTLICSETDPFVTEKADQKFFRQHRHPWCDSAKLNGHLLVSTTLNPALVIEIIQLTAP
jgi:hypothetical protein